MMYLSFILLMIGSVTALFYFVERRRNRTLNTLSDTAKNYRISRKTYHKKGALLLLSIFTLALSVFPENIALLENSIFPQVDQKIHKIFFLFDVSKSMNADDAPGGKSRLEWAKEFAGEFANSHRENAYGVAVFASGSLILSPITKDIGSINSFIESLDTKMLEDGGSHLYDATTFLAKVASSESWSLLVVFSDGWEKEDEISDEQLQQNLSVIPEKIPVITIGVGTQQGSRIPMRKDFFGNDLYRKFKGEEVITRLDSDSLKQIASISDGAYIQATSKTANMKTFDAILSKIPGIQDTYSPRPESYREWLLWIFLMLLVIEILLLEKKTVWKSAP